MNSSYIDASEMWLRIQNMEVMHLLDVREAIEYHTYNIGGNNIPLSAMAKNLPKLNCDPTAEIIVICKVGLRSKTAQAILQQNGYTNVRNLKGGLMALQKIK
jgi:adenylyltransferase/sulfurtransferase